MLPASSGHFVMERQLICTTADYPLVSGRFPHNISQTDAKREKIYGTSGLHKYYSYQDDFWICDKNYESCLHVWITLINLLSQLGFDINYKKLVAPTTCLVCLAIQLDTNTCP